MKTIGTALIAVAAIASMPAVAQVAPRQSPSAEERRRMDEIYALIDANHNGKLTLQEMQNFGIQHKMGPLVNTATWKRADTDKNGSLSKDELAAYLAQAQARREAAAKR